MNRSEELFERIISGGSAYIDLMIENMETEDLFMDYKRSTDNGLGRSLHNTDRSNLAKAISGFGNSEGGVIIWGVDCRNDPERGDVPSQARPINNPIKYKSLLEQVTTGLTIPAHDGVRHAALVQPNADQGFVVTYIPKGIHAPYQTVRDLRYLIRAGSNFVPVPHGVLAGMFGRQPQPNVFAVFLAEQNNIYGSGEFVWKFAIGLHNKGPGIAQDSYLNIHALSIGGPNNIMHVEQDQGSMWSSSSYARIMWNCTMRSDYRLAPDATVTPMIVTFVLRKPLLTPFKIKISTGANGAIPYKGECNVPPSELSQHFSEINSVSKSDFQEACRRFGDRLLRI